MTNHDDEPLTTFEVPLNDDAVERLLALAKATKTPPQILLASLLDELLRDEAEANGNASDEIASKIKGAQGKLH